MNKEKLKEFIAFLGKRTNVKSEELLEKDFYINLLLHKLNDNEYAFKGGTCLSKVYLSYHRISEDIDLTFIKQEIFKGKSTKQVKKICSGKITEFGAKIAEFSKLYDLDFKLAKSDRRYIELGSNNKLATFKVWYISAFSGTESFVKVQITFTEIMKFPFVKKPIIQLIKIDKIADTDKVYFGEFLKFYAPITYFVYDLREIASEKIRALLTRRAVKTRDIVDLYFIEKEHKIKIDKDVCIEKIIFAVKNYEKYKGNFITKADFFLSENIEHLMITDIDRKDFDAYFAKLLDILEEIRITVASRIKDGNV